MAGHDALRPPPIPAAYIGYTRYPQEPYPAYTSATPSSTLLPFQVAALERAALGRHHSPFPQQQERSASYPSTPSRRPPAAVDLAYNANFPVSWRSVDRGQATAGPCAAESFQGSAISRAMPFQGGTPSFHGARDSFAEQKSDFWSPDVSDNTGLRGGPSSSGKSQAETLGNMSFFRPNQLAYPSYHCTPGARMVSYRGTNGLYDNDRAWKLAIEARSPSSGGDDAGNGDVQLCGSRSTGGREPRGYKWTWNGPENRGWTRSFAGWAGDEARLATSLEVEVKLPEWYQLIRAAVVVTAKVEDLRHAREGQRPSPEYNLQKYPSRQEPWVMLWLRLQPTQRRRLVSPQQLMMPEDCLHYPNNTSAADWREFWPKTRETVFMVMLELKACSPCNDQSQVIAETMDPRRWSSWVVDVLWVFRQLLRILPLEEDAIMTCVKRAQNIREPETSAAALMSQTGERLSRLTAGPSSASVQTDGQLPASTSRQVVYLSIDQVCLSIYISSIDSDAISRGRKRALGGPELLPGSVKRSRTGD
ncbi:hypothetical protein LXA43DRAFT_1064031 [Ganoderma leucocontextum]|nr:hypothetical protein LXA43DRAFT_1064031 [Ganoderma leucocontextum]